MRAAKFHTNTHSLTKTSDSSGVHENLSKFEQVQSLVARYLFLPLKGGPLLYRLYSHRLLAVRVCQVDACAPCMWKDHQRALSTGGAFGCYKKHQLRTLHIVNYEQLGYRCNWCRGAPSMGDRMLRCDSCDVDVCNACLAAGTTAQAATAPPATAAAPVEPLRPPPPSYDDVAPLHDAGVQPPLPPRAPPPSYDDVKDSCSVDSPERETPAKGPTETPFRFDSVVRVQGGDDDKIQDRLMTVVGFEPCSDGDGDGVVVLQRKGQVFRVSAAFVCSVVD